MKQNIKMFIVCTVVISALFSCKKQEAKSPDAIPSEVVKQITAQGYSAYGAQAITGGYVVENDIFLSHEALNKPGKLSMLYVGSEEQYRTTNLVTGLPRTITLSVENLSAIWTAATDSTIARYNALNLRITFQRVASGATIKIVGKNLEGLTLGMSNGFPRANGNPADTVFINPPIFGLNPEIGFITTVLAHEVGHCIGFRHTDYRNRAYSCGGFVSNEGAAGVGAVWIPGTPHHYADPESWMLACAGGTSRPFNANDITALKYLYK